MFLLNQENWVQVMGVPGILRSRGAVSCGKLMEKNIQWKKMLVQLLVCYFPSCGNK
jgi:hypothetical protein